MEKKESQTTEFKKSLAETTEILETISAFANTEGGEILVGIEENKDGSIKEIIGISIKGKVIENLTNEVKQNTDPVIFPSIKIKRIKNKNVLEIKIEENSFKPVFTKGKVYKRVGRSTLKLTVEGIRKLIKNSTDYNFIGQVCKEARLKDIDEKKVGWFVKEAKRQRGLNLSETLPIKDVLMKLKLLLKDKKLTNACMLLFSKEPKFFQSEVKCIRFSGNEPVKPYIDFQTIEGNVFDLVDRAEDFVLRNIKKAIWLVPGQVQREEKHEYPPDAIREAIINAVAHRDYESPSKVQVRIFDDYIEIWNPGKLPEGWTVKKLKQKHESVPKNPLLFKQLFWVKYVEDVGGGTLDMIEQCKEWGILEPEFEDTGTSIVVTFRKSAITEKLMEELGLNERQKKAINYLKEHKKITNQRYCELFEVVKDTANRDLNNLLNKNLIEKNGSGPKIYYTLSTVRYRPIPSDKNV
ncbi:MAG: RNA-binding domain-containing protein [Nanoarchaeota archaeon]